MIADFFLRTYPKDYQWLPFLFRSLERHARGWRDIVIVIPSSSGLEAWKLAVTNFNRQAIDLKVWAERLRQAGALTGKIHLFNCEEFKDDYLGQCLTKLQAWKYTDADEVCFLDSDLVFTRGPFFPSSLHPKGFSPIIEIRDWADAGAALPAWFEVTKWLLGGDSPPYETMCRHPFQYPAQFLRRAWNFAEERLGQVNRRISEFNYLGNYARLYEPGQFVFRQPDHLHQEGLPTPDFHPSDWVRQFRSWDGLTPEVEAELRMLDLWEDHHE